MNISVIIGNLGADAEVVSTNGSKFITLSIGESRRWKTASGEEKSETNWIDAVIPNADHPILPFLKQGVRVCIVGRSSLRVYSSKKDRCMKAGQTIHVMNIELCGGSSDDVPRSLIDPATAQIYEVSKHYWVNRDNKALKKDESYVMVDQRGREFLMNKAGFVVPVVPEKQGEGSEIENNSTSIGQ